MNKRIWIFSVVIIFLLVLYFNFFGFPGSVVNYKKNNQTVGTVKVQTIQTKPIAPLIPPLNIALYNQKLSELANNPPDPIVYNTIKTVTKNSKGKSITTITKVLADPQPVVVHLWPVETVYPNAGALLPFSRIVAYYGNLYSTKMGALGASPEPEMLEKLGAEVKKWQVADPATPVIPALHYIAVVAQGYPGSDGKYRVRMPSTEIDKVIAMAAKIDAVVFLDVQVGFSDVQTEIPLLQKYLKMPNVHLGIDPEFSMKTGVRPGKVVGTLDATDINFVSNYLANLVRENNLPPKILIIHRYTEGMVTNYKQIKTMPEVQIVMDMDGWGDKEHKIETYHNFIYREPVQFAGFKLFYKNDTLTPGSSVMTPEDILKLRPKPIYIQYQ